MTFLNPAVLFGLITASIPVVIHFLNLRKLKKIEFSTLAFLKELQKTKIKRIKLKQLLLLLLRIAIIIFLVAAFARPTVKSVSIGSTSAVKTTAVLIVDNTFSMSVVGTNGSCLNHSKQIAKNLLNNFQEGDDITLLPAGDILNERMQPTTNFKQLIKQIDELQISSVSKTLNESIVNASRILDQSKNFNKEIYLLTDLQKGRIYNSPGELSNLSKILNGNVRLYLVDVSEKEPVNLGIDDLKPNNQIFEKGKAVSFAAKIKNYSRQPVNNSVVSLFLNGKRSAQQSLNLNERETKEVNFETTLTDTGLVEVSAELEDDDILNDNKRFFSIYVPNKISALILSDKQADTQFLKLAIEDPSKQKRTITENNLSRLSSMNLQNYDVVISIGSENTSDWKNLLSYVEQGGSVIITPGSENTLSSFQRLCEALNVSKPQVAAGKFNSRESIVQFDKIDFQNPVFFDLFENNKQPKLESPDVYYYFKIIPSSNGKNIISMFDGSSFLSEYKVGTGKVFLFNSSLNLSWNNFPLKGFFAPLLNKLLLYSASKIKEQNSFLTGQEVTADISKHVSSQIKIVTPNSVTELVNSDSLINKNYFNYTRTLEPGTYKFYSANRLLDYISVNNDPEESVVEKENPAEFEDYLKQIGFEGKYYSLSSSDDFSKVIYQSRFGTELWKYFLIIVLMLAVIESFIARSSKKDISSIREP